MVYETALEDFDDLGADENVVDDTVISDVEESVSYRISSYGADYDIEGLVRRIDRGDIFVPDFQRAFVWNRKQASQFIESLLMGLPVPGIFLTLEANTNRQMVIDGHQRLKSLQSFYPGEAEVLGVGPRMQRPFALQGVALVFEGKKYVDLRQSDRRKLDDALIHATITRQLFPEEGLSSVYHIFQRLNSTGQRLVPQEIRHAIYQGPLLDTIKQLNDNPDWRAIFGPRHKRYKDQELILRFWSLCERSADYRAPMLGFLNQFVEDNRRPKETFLQEGAQLFSAIARAFNESLGNQAFRTKGTRQLNAAVFDSMAVGLANRMKQGVPSDISSLASIHNDLLQDPEYADTVWGGTARPDRVQKRIVKAKQAFEGL
jgi:hypothetical protein